MNGQGTDLSQIYAFGNYSSIGQIINQLINPFLAICGALVLFYLIYGAIRLMLSGGNKETVASVQKNIQYAIIGLVLILLIFAFINSVPTFFNANIKIINR